MITLKWEGLTALQRQMQTVAPKMRMKVMDAGTRAGAAIIKQEARALAPKGKTQKRKAFPNYKHLKDSIVYAKGKKHFLARSMGLMHFPGDTLTHIVGLGKGGMHGIPVHYGHRIVARGPGKLQSTPGYRSNKGRFRSRGTVVGYSPPNEFLRKAMERNAKRITEIMRNKMQKVINSKLLDI